MKRNKAFALFLLVFLTAALLAVPAMAAVADDSEDFDFLAANGVTDSDDYEAYMTIATAGAAAGGAIAMGLAIGKAAEGIARQPEAQGNIRTVLMLGLVFIETAIIYALLAVILIIFVL